MQTLLCSTGKVLSKHCDWRRFIPSDGVQFTRSLLQLFRGLAAIYPAENFRAKTDRLLCEWERRDAGSRSYPVNSGKSAKGWMDVLQKIYRNNPVVMWREWGGKWWTECRRKPVKFKDQSVKQENIKVKTHIFRFYSSTFLTQNTKQWKNKNY